MHLVHYYSHTIIFWAFSLKASHVQMLPHKKIYVEKISEKKTKQREKKKYNALIL